MKRLVSLAVVSALLIGGAFAVFHFSGARGKVMKKNALEAFDKMIGDTDVKREQIKERMTKLQGAIDRLNEEQFRSEAEADTQVRYIKALDAKVGDAETSLQVLQKQLTEVGTSKKPVSIGGKDYSEPELDAMAKKIIVKHKEWKTELTSLKENHQRLQNRASKFKERAEELTTELATLKKDMKAIDDKIKEVESLKRAAAAMGDADQTVGENLEDLKKSVSDLNANLEVRLRKEDKNWEKVGKSGDETEKFITATKGSADTLSEIDAILKNKK